MEFIVALCILGMRTTPTSDSRLLPSPVVQAQNIEAQRTRPQHHRFKPIKFNIFIDYSSAGFKYCNVGDYQTVFTRPGDVAAFGSVPYNSVRSDFS
ncbi:cyclopropane-fatty-acyl-phospholipid synthase [Salvia divinorum]|uniref:Cyclopropane-fatty-acyl-phospholipid synthase n=1 Tax=Salvia divinorum TaxID=28513 RepID=A0ABD1GG90_SALDI